jgi:hypothetical protein
MKIEQLDNGIGLVGCAELLDCRHAVEVGESKKKNGYSLYNIFNRRWLKIFPTSIYARSELEAIIRCRSILEEKLAGLVGASINAPKRNKK